MDIFLDETHSLYLLRASQQDADYTLREAQNTCVSAPGLAHTTLQALGIPALLDYLKIPDRGTLGLLVPDGKSRIRARGIRCRVWARPRGPAAFYELVSSDPKHPSPIVPRHTHVFALSPENIVLGMARRLRKLELEGRMSHQRAVLMLLKLCLELCGTYAHDPNNPHTGSVTYKVRPPLSAQRLAQFVADEGNECGLGLLREVVPLVYDGSASPQESFLGIALFGEHRLGGLALGDLMANKELNLDDAERRSIEYRTITPDFQMPGHRIAIEFNGKDHEKGDNPHIDRIRMLDYQTLRIQAFVFTYADVCDQKTFMRSAARIVRVMEWRDGRAVVERFARLRRSDVFCQRQQVLFEVFRPWERNGMN